TDVCTSTAQSTNKFVNASNGRHSFHVKFIYMNNNRKVTTNKQIHNLIILDESGSMESIKPQILAGFNETIQVIKEDEKAHPELKHLLTFISFNSATGNKMSLDAAPI